MKLTITLTTTLILSLATCGLSAAPANVGRVFHPDENAIATVDAAIAAARANDRLALVVLGANWCHDSRALGSRLDQSPLKEVLEASYELAVVDVGYYEHGQDVMRHLGEAIYYATPTVLIVDPATRQVINNHNRRQWGAAADVSMANTVAYFETMARAQGQAADPKTGNAERLAQIRRFEQEQAIRLAKGYEALQPLLRVLGETRQRPDDFDERWAELADFRGTLARDLEELRADDGAQDSLTLPVYPLKSWER
ncbi:MAG: thioredoxin family protein [Pseudomonadota bacterium]